MRWTLVLFLLLLLHSSGRSQSVISGRISDDVTLENLPAAAIFFPELYRGTYSDSLGNFSLAGVHAGKILMEVSHVGYASDIRHLIIRGDSILEIRLVPAHTLMREVVVTGWQSQVPDETSFNIAQLTRSSIDQSAGLHISDAIARLPGVSQLTTGPGISKPVIRGLYGNRIQVNVNGQRFDNQQWQDEHGLGLSDIGIDRVEVIRGPASVLYGSDALGGVVNIVEERPAPSHHVVRDLNARVYSNTFGVALNYGTLRSDEKRWRRMRFGLSNHADYSDGKNDRILNSRFATYDLKMSWGRNKASSTHVWNVIASHSLFGFVFDSLGRKTKDGRLSRTFDGPHHAVSFAQVSTENTYFREHQKIKLTGGFTSNLRLEDEGGGGISLSMLLNSLNGQVQITRLASSHGEWTSGVSIFAQTNTNFGGRIIVPDALLGEGSAFTYYHFRKNKWLWETGARYDAKFIETLATNSLNVIGNGSPTEEIFPFQRFYNAVNLSAGTAHYLARAFRFKVNASTGFRPGNLAELSSNGLHEGTVRWEIGKQNAKIEQNLNLEGTLLYDVPTLRVSVSYYQNRFRNFFFLSPDGTEYFGFQVYHFRQTDATLEGGEVTAEWSPTHSSFGLSGSYSIIDASKGDGDPLPFIPANKVMGKIDWRLKAARDFTEPLFFISGQYSFSQKRPAEFETKTDSYLLLNTGFSGVWKGVRCSLTVNNLINKMYYDHLSRYKYYGIANMGRSIIVGTTFKF